MSPRDPWTMIEIVEVILDSISLVGGTTAASVAWGWPGGVLAFTALLYLLRFRVIACYIARQRADIKVQIIAPEGTTTTASLPTMRGGLAP